MEWRTFTSDAYSDGFARLDSSIRQHALRVMGKIVVIPFVGKSLKGPGNFFRVRLGQYRIIYRIELETIHFSLIDKRDVVYRLLEAIQRDMTRGQNTNP